MCKCVSVCVCVRLKKKRGEGVWECGVVVGIFTLPLVALRLPKMFSGRAETNGAGQRTGSAQIVPFPRLPLLLLLLLLLTSSSYFFLMILGRFFGILERFLMILGDSW